MKKIFFLLSPKVTLKGRDASGFPTVVGVAGSPDTGLDDVFGDVVKTACRRRTSSSTTTPAPPCQQVRIETAGGDVIVS